MFLRRSLPVGSGRAEPLVSRRRDLFENGPLFLGKKRQNMGNILQENR